MRNLMGPALWKKAKKFIPGGNQLLSKRTEKFLPDLWPSYYSKARGCEVWNLDGERFYDFAGMGVASCIIGYSDDDINAAVIESIKNGSMSSLNCAEEVELAENLLALNPWAGMARFSRTGGEACAIAIRIARAAANKPGIAFCGYHGWHDWYLSANLGDASNLDGQLLPGLNPLGVPRQLKNTAFPFNYNRLDELQEIVNRSQGDIGVIIMEPQRGTEPAPGFLQGVRDIATRIGAVLVFDEVTSGFRMNIGGIHRVLNVDPDIAVFGKALGNGFPISAIIGRREVMDGVQDSFVSSTFWTERIGYTAALASLKKMGQCDVQSYLIKYGEKIQKGWQEAARKHGLNIHAGGIAPLPHLSFATEDPLAVQTLFTQEMLKNGYLAGTSLATSYAYSDEIIDGYLAACDAVFGQIQAAISRGQVRSQLEGEVAHAGFKRLT